jgi:CubicO group peptidase (beta-lactamase class C family)
MAETRYNSDDLKPGDNVATGHAKFDFKDLRPVGVTSWRNVSGAGGIYSSVHDLAKWMNVQLAGGVFTRAVAMRRNACSPSAPARDVDGADADPGRQAVGARPGRGPRTSWVTAGLEPVRLRRRASWSGTPAAGRGRCRG